MGDNIEASNFALPPPASSGISKDAAAIEMLKDRERKANIGDQWTPENVAGTNVMGGGPARQFSGRGMVSTTVVLDLSGAGVHRFVRSTFLFDFSLDGVDSDVWAFERRLHRWILTRLYPGQLGDLPGCAAEVLFARKEKRLLRSLKIVDKHSFAEGRKSATLCVSTARNRSTRFAPRSANSLLNTPAPQYIKRFCQLVSVSFRCLTRVDYR